MTCCDYERILNKIQADERYQRNLDWGRPRAGHPEGSVRLHIGELEENLDALRQRLSDADYWKLKILIHTHDTFKANGRLGVPISDPRSHASLAREFLKDYCDDADLLDMVQLHDEPYALWRRFQTSGSDKERLSRLVERISDWDLFLTFLIIDGCTEGKSREPLIWFFDEIQSRVDSHATRDWLL